MAVRAACAQLVERLRPLTKDLGDSFTWQQVVKKAFFLPGFPPSVRPRVAAEASLSARRAKAHIHTQRVAPSSTSLRCA